MKYLATLAMISLLLVVSVQRPADAESDEWLVAGLEAVVEETTLLGEAGAFTSHPLVNLLIAYNGQGFATDERADLLFELDWNDRLGVESLTGAPAELSTAAETTLGRLSIVDRAAIESGQTGFMDPQPYLYAIGDLLRRSGEAPSGARDPGEQAILDTFIRERSWTREIEFADYAQTPSAPTTTTTSAPPTATSTAASQSGPTFTAAPGTAPSQTLPIPAWITARTSLVANDPRPPGAGAQASTGDTSEADTPGQRRILDFEDPTGVRSNNPADLLAFNASTGDETSGSQNDGRGLGGGSWLPLALLALLIVTAGGTALLLLGRRPDRQHDFRLIAETSRKLAECDSQAAVVKTAVVDTARFTGASGCAYLTFTPTGLNLADATDEAFFVATVVERGVLFDVAKSGHAVRATVENDPAFGRRSMAIAAVPVFENGQVAGVLAVTREPSSPFGADVLEALGALAPMLGSALQSMVEFETAVQGSEVDWLTSLANRRRFDNDLSDLTTTTQRIGVAMIDVDHFKSFNDTYGHETGDMVLRSVAETLTASIQSNHRAYRYGGEEFSILLEDVTNAEAAAVVERLRLAVQRMALPDTHATRRARGSSVTVSIGLTLGPARYAVELLAAADEALYMAKRDGRNRVIVRATPASMDDEHAAAPPSSA